MQKTEAKSEYLLETNGLRKEFGGIVAIEDVSLKLEKGEIRCLIGPNGAGKSTLFKLLTGKYTPTSGSVRFKNEDITQKLPHKRIRKGISIKFQDANVYKKLSTAENIRIPLQQKEKIDIKQRINELLNQINLQNERDTMASELSHGQQQWLEIAMSIALDPDLLLLDEPTAGMTEEETKKTIDLIQTLNDSGMTVVIVEHDIEFVNEIAEWITVLHHGSIFAQGKSEDIKSNEKVREIYLGEE